jgi:histidine triad (HIT) family protein
MASIFSKIIAGELPSYKIAETENYLAFLDVFPLTEGHVLVIPKKETDNIFDIEEEEFAGLHLYSLKL